MNDNINFNAFFSSYNKDRRSIILNTCKLMS